MGTSGAGIFQDDTALDVRDRYRELLALGHDDSDVIASIREGLGSAEDDEDGAVVALALAAVQWEYGRLDDDVRDRALEVIDSGLDLRRWEGSRLLQKRRSVLSGLRAKLLSPQPKRKTPRRQRPIEVPAHRSVSPDGLARATAIQIAAPGGPGGARMQVLIERVVNGSLGGGGVFVARCDYQDVGLQWLDSATVEIAYPRSATVESQASESFYLGRIVSVRYAPR